MKKHLIASAFALLLTSLAYSQSTPEFPAGWKAAIASDYSAENLSFMKNRVPNHVEADFNGDGKIDYAWILVNTSRNMYGLFVFLGEKNGGHKVITLNELKRETDKLYMGLSLMKSGQYKTACGKGYWECKPGEPQVLKLKYPGINFFMFESADSVYYWDSRKKEFKRIWLSD